MKFHSGTHSGTAVSDLEMVNFSIIEKRGKGNQIEIVYGKRVIGSEGGATVSYNTVVLVKAQAKNMVKIDAMEAVEDLVEVEDWRIIGQNQ